MQPTLITTAEAAERLKVSIPTVNRWVRDGRLQPVQKLPGIRGANLFDPQRHRCPAELRMTTPTPAAAIPPGGSGPVLPGG
jgi:hypothetical protein